MTQASCAICGRPCRGMVHAGHCHDVYHGRQTSERRKQQRTTVADIAARLRAVGEYVRHRQAVAAMWQEQKMAG